MRDPLFSYDAMGWYAGRYMPAGDRSAPLASPVFASHVFQLLFGVLDEADEALDEVARFFTRHLG